MKFILSLIACAILLSCSGTKQSAEPSAVKENPAASLPAHYKDLVYPPFAYTAPHPKDFRVELDSGAAAYLVRDTSLALVDMKFFFGGENRWLVRALNALFLDEDCAAVCTFQESLLF